MGHMRKTEDGMELMGARQNGIGWGEMGQNRMGLDAVKSDEHEMIGQNEAERDNTTICNPITKNMYSASVTHLLKKEKENSMPLVYKN